MEAVEVQLGYFYFLYAVLYCAMLGIPFNGYFEHCNHHLGSVCAVRCNHGFAVTGSAQRTCEQEEAGPMVWSGSPAQCSCMFVKNVQSSVVVETVSETSHQVQVKSNKHHNRIYILNFEHEKNLGLFWSSSKMIRWKKCILWGNWVSNMSRICLEYVSNMSRICLEKVSARPWPLKNIF